MNDTPDPLADRMAILNDLVNATTAPRRTVTVRFGPAGDGPLASASFTEVDGTPVEPGDPVALHGGPVPPDVVAALVVGAARERR